MVGAVLKSDQSWEVSFIQMPLEIGHIPEILSGISTDSPGSIFIGLSQSILTFSWKEKRRRFMDTPVLWTSFFHLHSVGLGGEVQGCLIHGQLAFVGQLERQRSRLAVEDFSVADVWKWEKEKFRFCPRRLMFFNISLTSLKWQLVSENEKKKGTPFIHVWASLPSPKWQLFRPYPNWTSRRETTTRFWVKPV